MDSVAFLLSLRNINKATSTAMEYLLPEYLLICCAL